MAEIKLLKDLMFIRRWQRRWNCCCAENILCPEPGWKKQYRSGWEIIKSTRPPRGSA